MLIVAVSTKRLVTPLVTMSAMISKMRESVRILSPIQQPNRILPSI